jgi:hypothetical protein
MKRVLGARTAAKVSCVVAVIAASCALPAYHTEGPDGSNGGAGSGGEAGGSTTNAGGAGGGTGCGDGTTWAACPDNGRPGEPCDCMNDSPCFINVCDPVDPALGSATSLFCDPVTHVWKAASEQLQCCPGSALPCRLDHAELCVVTTDTSNVSISLCAYNSCMKIPDQTCPTTCAGSLCPSPDASTCSTQLGVVYCDP